MTREELERRIVAAAGEVPGVSTLLLFGSWAKDRARPDSDLDIAVLPAFNAEEGTPKARFRLQAEIASALADLAPEGRVDVVLLDEAPDTLRQRVMEHGRILVCRDPEAWQELRVQTMREYGDREWARKMYNRALRQRLIEGRPSGRSARAVASLERARRVHR